MTRTESDRVFVGTVDDLHESATRATGLDDFGDPSDGYRDALGVLLDSLHTDASLTPEGSKFFRSNLKGALVARLLSEAGFTVDPAHADNPVERPIFVTGLPRTGTTALHRLLGSDPANQGLELWLADAPRVRPPRSEWNDDPTYRGLHEIYSGFMAENPDYGGMHYLSADDLEECWQLLRQSFTSVSYECLARLDGYSNWLAGIDWTDSYRRHKRNLQLIGAAERDKRWVLKNPSHLFALDELLAVYPDAIVVATHRDPRTSMASMCSLAHTTAGEWATAFTPDYVGRSQLELWARGAREFEEARGRHREAEILDVTHRELIDDPVAVVERVYAAAGADLDDVAREAIRATNAQSLSGDRRPRHAYSLADYGLSVAQIEEAFVGYRGLDM